MRTRDNSARQLRSFGFIVAGGFAVIALWPVVWRHGSVRTWALILSTALAVSAIVLPSALRPVHRVWMVLGEVLGWVNSRIILSVVYYLVIVPLGTARRLFGSDPMRRNFEPDADTYKIARAARPAAHMKQQY
jgi:saxitoxin biosynthesis operon SxtJ-like protein